MPAHRHHNLQSHALRGFVPCTDQDGEAAEKSGEKKGLASAASQAHAWGQAELREASSWLANSCTNCFWWTSSASQSIERYKRKTISLFMLR